MELVCLKIAFNRARSKLRCACKKSFSRSTLPNASLNIRRHFTSRLVPTPSQDQTSRLASNRPRPIHKKIAKPLASKEVMTCTPHPFMKRTSVNKLPASRNYARAK
jgi:hypothetical protein